MMPTWRMRFVNGMRIQPRPREKERSKLLTNG